MKSRDQEINFDAGGNDGDTAEETKNIEDMTIDIGNARTAESVLQQDDTVTRTQNTTVLTVEND